MNLNEREAWSSVAPIAPDLDSKAVVLSAIQYSTDEQLVGVGCAGLWHPGLANAERAEGNIRPRGRPEAEEASAVLRF